MTPLVKTHLRAEELAMLHRVAKAKNRRVADLVREAIREKYLPRGGGPVALWDGPFAGSAEGHDEAFDEP